MSTFRRIILSGGLGIDIDIDSLPETQKIYYTATSKVKPSANSLGVVIVNKWDSSTKEGVIACENTIEEIGNYAFKDCSSLTSVTIPDSVTSIGSDVFNCCSSLTNVTIGNSVTLIGERAFRNCTSLESIPIPESVTSIGDSAFSGCDSLTSITIPDSVTSIGDRAFFGCSGELIINSKIVETNYPYNDYPSKYGWISGSKFTKFTIGDNITSIGSYMFKDCNTLTTITIPDSVTKIGGWAFDRCTNIKNVYIKDITSWCNIYYGNSSSHPLNVGTNIYLNNELLTDLIIPNGMISIESYLFRGCASLKSLIIPDSVITIRQGAFSNCRNLTSVTIGSKVGKLEDYAFSECTALQYCDFSTLNADIPVSVYTAFLDIPYTCKIIVPDVLYDKWIASTNWSAYADNIIKKSDWDASQVTE